LDTVTFNHVVDRVMPLGIHTFEGEIMGTRSSQQLLVVEKACVNGHGVPHEQPGGQRPLKRHADEVG